MENPNADKVELVAEISELFATSDAVLLTEYRGLAVKQLGALRATLRPAGGSFRVLLAI